MPLSSASRGRILAAYTTGVLALTLVPVPSAVHDTLPWWSDKATHVILFSSLAVVCYWYRVAAGRATALAVIGPVAALAGFVELAQGPLPYRAGDVWDFIWGAVGAAVGYGVAAAARSRAP